MSKDAEGTAPRREPTAASWRGWIGYALAAGSLVWVFHDMSFASLWDGIRRMEPRWIAAAMAADALAYLAQGWRWHRLLAAIGEIGALEATAATYAGLYVNEILPFRMGELLRIHLAARRLGNAYQAVFSSVIVERFIDAAWLSAALSLVLWSTELPGYLRDAERILAGVVAAGLVSFVALALVSERRARRAAMPSENRAARMFRSLGESLLLVGRSRGFAWALAASPAVLGFQALAYYFVGVSYGLPVTFGQMMAAFLVMHVGNIVPSAPGNVGTYQLFAVLGLTLFGVDKTSATAFSIVAFLILTIPLWAIGSVCFARAGLDLRSIRGDLSRWRTNPAKESL